VAGAASLSSSRKKEDCHFGCPALSAAGAHHRCRRQAARSKQHQGRDGRGGRASFMAAALRTFARCFVHASDANVSQGLNQKCVNVNDKPLIQNPRKNPTQEPAVFILS
jgi:hypothetical protein